MSEQKTILVVDDEEGVRKVLAEILSSSGYRVLTAQSALEGLIYLEKKRIDLVLLDLRMPELSGEDFLTYRKVREMITKQRHISVIVISGALTMHLRKRIICLNRIRWRDYASK